MSKITSSSSSSIHKFGLTLEPGDVLWDRYEIIECLGEGSSAIVYKCYDISLSNLPIALKIFPASIASDAASATRLNRELRTSFGVDHSNVARFYNCVRDDEFIGLSMEYVEGGTLAQYAQKLGGQLSVAEVKFILTQVCEGLHAIHKVGAVHRDLKPANILISKDGSVKITDFGLARNIIPTSESTIEIKFKQPSNPEKSLRTTSVGDCVGTPLYLSPEYLEHGLIDERSDIYAVGVIGFEFTSGKEPFHADSFIKLVSEKIHYNPPELTDLFPECPQEFNDIIMTALEKDPEHRYQSAKDLAQDLRSFKVEGGNRSIAYFNSGVINNVHGEGVNESNYKNNFVSSRIESPHLSTKAYDASSGFLGALINNLVVGVPIVIILFVISYLLFSEDINFADRFFTILRRVYFLVF